MMWGQRNRLRAILSVFGVAGVFCIMSLFLPSVCSSASLKNTSPHLVAMAKAKVPEVALLTDGAKSPTYVVIETDRGNMTLELFADVAPKTVGRFSELVRKGFYNGVIFSRVLPSFLIQTEHPAGSGKSDTGQTIPAEFNEKKHRTGTVGMARRSDPDSADSQFYICLEAQPFLDGKYTVFGQVIEGLEVLPKIQAQDVVRKIWVKS